MRVHVDDLKRLSAGQPRKNISQSVSESVEARHIDSSMVHASIENNVVQLRSSLGLFEAFFEIVGRSPASGETFKSSAVLIRHLLQRAEKPRFADRLGNHRNAQRIPLVVKTEKHRIRNLFPQRFVSLPTVGVRIVKTDGDDAPPPHLFQVRWLFGRGRAPYAHSATFREFHP